VFQRSSNRSTQKFCEKQIFVRTAHTPKKQRAVANALAKNRPKLSYIIEVMIAAANASRISKAVKS